MPRRTTAAWVRRLPSTRARAREATSPPRGPILDLVLRDVSESICAISIARCLDATPTASWTEGPTTPTGCALGQPVTVSDVTRTTGAGRQAP